MEGARNDGRNKSPNAVKWDDLVTQLVAHANEIYHTKSAEPEVIFIFRVFRDCLLKSRSIPLDDFEEKTASLS